jgi:hypothetical protein
MPAPRFRLACRTGRRVDDRQGLPHPQPLTQTS